MIGCDTVVVRDSEPFNGATDILEKPRDHDHAVAMLSSLSGRAHTVYTGVCLVLPKCAGIRPCSGCLGYVCACARISEGSPTHEFAR